MPPAVLRNGHPEPNGVTDWASLARWESPIDGSRSWAANPAPASIVWVDAERSQVGPADHRFDDPVLVKQDGRGAESGSSVPSDLRARVGLIPGVQGNRLVTTLSFTPIGRNPVAGKS